MSAKTRIALLGFLGVIAAAFIAKLPSCDKPAIDSRGSVNQTTAVTIQVASVGTQLGVQEPKTKQANASSVPKTAELETRAEVPPPEVALLATQAAGEAAPHDVRAAIAKEYHQRGLKQLQKAQWQEAQRSFITATELDPTFTEARLQLAVSFINGGAHSEAIVELLVLRGLQEQDPWIYHLHASALNAQKKFSAALEQQEIACRLAPQETEFQLQLAELLNSNSKFERADQILTALLPQHSDRFELFVNRGIALWRLGRLPEARASFQRATEIKPKNYVGFANLAEVCWELKDWNSAISAFNTTISLVPRESRFLRRLGTLYDEKADYILAAQTFRKAIAADPKDATSYDGLARSLVKRGDNDGAIEQLKKALEVQPEAINARLLLGSLFSQRGQFAEAIDVTRIGIAFNPSQPALFENLSIFYHKAGLLAEAIRAARDALSLSPEKAVNNFRLGLLLRESGEIERATVALQQAVLIEPEDVEYRYAIGQILLIQKKYGEALVHLERAANIDPGNQEVAAALVEARKRTKRK